MRESSSKVVTCADGTFIFEGVTFRGKREVALTVTNGAFDECYLSLKDNEVKELQSALQDMQKFIGESDGDLLEAHA